MQRRRPIEGEKIYDYEREAQGLRADGRIWLVNQREQDLTVKFSPNRVEFRTDHCVRVNGILHNRSILRLQPWLINTDDAAVVQRVTYDFWDLEWDSHDGGLGSWIHYGSDLS